MHTPFRSVEADYETIARDPYVVVISRSSPLASHIYEKGGKPYIDLRLLANEQYILA